MQLSSKSNDSSADFDHRVALFPTRSAAHVTTEIPAQSAVRPAASPKMRVRTYDIREVVVLEVVGRLSDVVDDLDRATQLALADGPRGVVCDLSIVFDGVEAGAVEMLATAGRHVRDWAGIPVAVACPDPRVREALRAHPLGRHLIVTASVLTAVSAVLATPVPVVEWLRLAPHPTAPRVAREFVAQTLLDWGLGPLIPSASLVVSELVTNATIHAGTDIAVSIAWSLDALRLTVRDNSPDLPRHGYSQPDLHGRGLTVVAGLSRSYGVLPTADGGKVVWAVLNAARSDQPLCPEPATTAQDPPILTDARGPTGLRSAPSPAHTQPTRERTGSRQLMRRAHKRHVERCPDTVAIPVLRSLRQMTQDGHSNLCVTERTTHDQPRC